MGCQTCCSSYACGYQSAKLLMLETFSGLSDPLQVPSGYYLTDAFIYLDKLLKCKLFKPSDNVTRVDLAAHEAVRLKKCIQSLRFLWRSSPAEAQDPRVADLKRYLQDSPQKRRPHRADVSRLCLGFYSLTCPFMTLWAEFKNTRACTSDSGCWGFPALSWHLSGFAVASFAAFTCANGGW